MPKEKDPSLLMKRITEHFNDKQIRTFTVAEWGENKDTPLEIYIKPITVREKSKFLADVRKIGELQAFVNLIIAKALDAQGKNLFTIKDAANFLTNADPDIVLNVGLDMAYIISEEGEKTLAEK